MLQLIIINNIHTRSVALLWAKDRPVAQEIYLPTDNIHNRQPSVPPAGFEPPPIPSIDRAQKYTLDLAAIGIGKTKYSGKENCPSDIVSQVDCPRIKTGLVKCQQIIA